MPEVLTHRQREILDYLKHMLKEKAYPPTVREIGLAIGLSSSSTVQNHLNTLERKGYIHRDPAKSRAIELVEKDPVHERDNKYGRIIALPIIGQVAAGTPVLAEQNIEDHVEMTGTLFGEDSFLLRVKGDSMIDDGIFDGDLVAVRPQPEATNGSVVVARIDNPDTGEPEATVKRIYREADGFRLEPANAAYSTIRVPDLTVEGVVVGVLRVSPRGL
ncbi:MAG TPA: transcriptional repressor LexA [Candidatus Dormibacteraeota bacterium]|jgi:repressor LexA|nr:transcriptional repressor LexA [Candidatus Dormibacteraeota bacterium]